MKSTGMNSRESKPIRLVRLQNTLSFGGGNSSQVVASEDVTIDADYSAGLVMVENKKRAELLIIPMHNIAAIVLRAEGEDATTASAPPAQELTQPSSDPLPDPTSHIPDYPKPSDRTGVPIEDGIVTSFSGGAAMKKTDADHMDDLESRSGHGDWDRATVTSTETTADLGADRIPGALGTEKSPEVTEINREQLQNEEQRAERNDATTPNEDDGSDNTAASVIPGADDGSTDSTPKPPRDSSEPDPEPEHKTPATKQKKHHSGRGKK